MNPNDPTAQGNDAMQEFGFEAVPLDRPGAPTPGRIADRLGDITTALDQAVASGDLGAIVNGVAKLGRLRIALAAWDGWMKGQEALRVLRLDEPQKANDTPTGSAPEEKDEGDQAIKRLFRRRACYSETWWFDQVLVDDSIIDLGEGDCTDAALMDVKDAARGRRPGPFTFSGGRHERYPVQQPRL